MNNTQNIPQPLVAPKLDEGGSTRLPRQSHATAGRPPTTLNQFTQPAKLRELDPRRINILLRRFADDFAAAGITLPDHEALNGEYYSAIEGLLAGPLPDRLRTAMIAIETAAAPENATQLDSLIKEHIPNVGINPAFPLDCALEVWFHAPAALDQFVPLVAPVGPLPSAGAPDSGLNLDPNQKPKIEIQKSLSLTDSSPPAAPPLHHSATPSLPSAHLLDSLAATLRRHVVLPTWTPEALALFIVHTYAFQLRDVTAYIGVESPEKRCGKTTLLTLISQLVSRPVVASNISPPAFFRVIEELRPTLLIDEADTFLRGNDELRGILNAGNRRDTAFVVRVATTASSSSSSSSSSSLPLTDSLTHPLTTPSSPSSPDARPEGPRHSTLATFSSWCPKMIASIGHLPETLADRCIIVRMQRKTTQETCERLRNLDAEPLRRQCAQFVADHSAAIAAAHPPMPTGLNDRAVDIWDPKRRPSDARPRLPRD